MKKFIVFALALLLAVPALSFAGSATSRWDVTIGGFIKADFGYNSQAQGADYISAAPGSDQREVLADEYGNFYSAAGESRLNFLIKGPDGWGAKTMAFIEGDFRGSSGGLGDTYGGFGLRHAFMKMMWERDSLTIGQTWQVWGSLPTFANILLGYNDLGPFLKGSRQPQIMWNHDFNKNWGFSAGIISPNNVNGTLGNTRVDEFSLSGYPFGEAELRWTSDACGKIGPWQMLFGLSGFYGQDRKITVNNVAVSPIPATTPYSYEDDMEDAWGMAFKAFIPIIPEQKGNKTGALSLSGLIFAAQNPSWYFPFAVSARSYSAVDPQYYSPRIQGGWGQMTYFFTNDFFVTGWYGYMKNKLSNRNQAFNTANFLATGTAVIDTLTFASLNFSYDVNPAIRLGIEGDYIWTKYSAISNDLIKRSNDLWSVRVGAWYFF